MMMMKLDDRDIVCEQDYTPLSNAELVEAIERYAKVANAAPAFAIDPEWITGPARALLARAEAAEAEAGQLRDELAAMTERVTFARRSASLAENALETARSRWDEAERREKSIFDSAMGIADQRDTLATRVAELEAASDAQGWRPVTEKPTEPPDGETSEYLTWNDFVGFTVRRYHDGQFHSAFRKQPTHWRPLPPAPQETTP